MQSYATGIMRPIACQPVPWDVSAGVALGASRTLCRMGKKPRMEDTQKIKNGVVLSLGTRHDEH